MSLSNLDYLSPSVTLFYLGKRGHLSNISGCLSIILSIIIILFIIFFLLLKIKLTIYSSSFYKQYEINDVNYYFKESGLFHFFYLITSNNTLKNYDNPNKYIRIIAYNDDVKNSYNDHWLYGLCEEDISDNLLNKTIFHENYFFQQSLCLKYYYDSQSGKYYTNNDNEFKYPFIKNNFNNNNQTLSLNINVEKCENNSFNSGFNTQYNYHCAPENEINIFLSELKDIYLYYHNHNVIIDNYNLPFYTTLFHQKYSLENNNMLQINTIYFSLLKIRTYTGFFLENEKNSFTVDCIKEKLTLANNNNLLFQTSFQISEYSHIYTRYYYSLFKDIFPRIGGTIQICYYVFYLINYFYYKYICLSDGIDEIIKIERQKISISVLHNFLKRNNDQSKDISNTKSQKTVFKLKINEINNNSINNSNSVSINASKRSKRSHNVSKTPVSNKFSHSYKNIKKIDKPNDIKNDYKRKRLSKIDERNFLDYPNDNSQAFLFQQAQIDNSLNCNYSYLNQMPDNLKKNSSLKEKQKYVNFTPKFNSVISNKNEENTDDISKNKSPISRHLRQNTKRQVSKFSEQNKKNEEYLSKIIFNKELQNENISNGFHFKSNMKKNWGCNLLIDNKKADFKRKSYDNIYGYRRSKLQTPKKKVEKEKDKDKENELKYLCNLSLKNVDFFGLLDSNAMKKLKKQLNFWKFFISINRHSSADYINEFINMRNEIVSEEQMFSNYINIYNIDKYFRERNKHD